MTENRPEETSGDGQNTDEQGPDELEQSLLDAMRDLGRKNKKVENYLDGLERTVEKPAPEKPATEEPAAEKGDAPPGN